MKPATRPRGPQAFTVVDCTVALAVLAAITVFVIMPNLRRSRPSQVPCTNNLKNIGLAFRIAAIDSGEFSFRLPESQGGTVRHALEPAELWRHFAALSNELSNPVILSCPEDTRQATFNHWESILTNDHNRAISYTIGLDASEEVPQSILSSDRNLSLDGLPVGMSVLSVRLNDSIGFTTNLHRSAGNLLFGDGSVQQVSNERLRHELTNAMQSTRSGAIRIVVP